MVAVYLLPAPWAHFDRESTVAGVGRQRLSPDEAVKIPVGVPLRLAAPVDARVQVSGYRMGVEQASLAYPMAQTSYEALLLSVGVRPDEGRLTVFVNDEIAGYIEIEGFAPRPGWSAGAEGGAPHSTWSEKLDQFLLRIVDLIRLADDPRFSKEQVMWDRLQKAWHLGDAENTIPPMALIVRHARTLSNFIADLASKPRKILSRTRELTPVDRVQQLDVSCIRWLSRQPGRTVYERAGPRQRIMAIQRHEDLNVLENRVLRDFSGLSDQAAAAYTKRYESLNASTRWRAVDTYMRECRRLERDLKALGITKPQPPVVPNYALLHDQRYRKLWRAYLEIRRGLDEEDEVWRWQGRLWLDFSRIILQIALRQSDDFELVAESPLRLSGEQRRGIWSVVGDQSAVFVTATERAGDVIVSLIWDAVAAGRSQHPKVASWMANLGASSALHAQSVESGKEVFILFWPVHFFARSVPNLKEIVESADRGLSQCINAMALNFDQDVSAGAVVMLSEVDEGNAPTQDWVARSGRVIGIRVSTSPKGRQTAFNRLPKSVLYLLDDLLR